MKQRKEFEKAATEKAKKPVPNKTVQELTEQVTQVIGKNPQKAARAIEFWLNDSSKTQKKAS